MKYVYAVAGAALLIAFLAPIVLKLRDITLIAVVLIGVVMMIVDMWQDLQD